ncbi:MAG: hypothetical protein HY064_16010 [Bacteroidetes bacterium]|nr:hypothetical protein [Bacteroidota bacterium]
MQRHIYKDLTIEIFNDPTYTLGSADNNIIYSKIYSTDIGKFRPTSKHGIKIFKAEQEINNCLLLAVGGATNIHPTASLVDNDQLVVCCCDTIFSLTLPDLQLKWKTKVDSVTCFQILKLQADYIVHGEMEITRLDRDGKIKWKYGGHDIFVELDSDAFSLHADHIEVTDFYKTKYKIDFNGKTISTSRQTEKNGN